VSKTVLTGGPQTYFRMVVGTPGCCGAGCCGTTFDEEETNMTLKITNRDVNGVSVVALDGRIVLGEERNTLREKLKSLIAQGEKKIVLNVDNIKYIDSAGLGTLIAAHYCAKTQGVSLRFSHLGSKFQDVLQVTKLLTVFDISDTETAAVASFSK
jgi:anti-sigma B factor antagonist